MSESAQSELRDQDWPRIIKELTLYANLRLKFWGLLKNRNLKGLEAKDIALKAIEAVLKGDWKWNSTKSDLLTYLKYHVVKGLVANLARNTEVVSMIANPQELLEEHDEYNQEDELNSSMVMQEIRESVKGDELLIVLVDELSSGMKRAEICEVHQISTEAYDNALRRLRTKLLQLQKKDLFKITYGKNKP